MLSDQSGFVGTRDNQTWKLKTMNTKSIKLVPDTTGASQRNTLSSGLSSVRLPLSTTTKAYLRQLRQMELEAWQRTGGDILLSLKLQ